jgi:hypothetical protein
MPYTHDHALVTGIMRSGTTYVGKVISQHPQYSYIHEPFSYQTGIKGVNHWFPYSNTPHSYYGQLLDDFLNLKFNYKHFEPPERGYVAANIKKVIGGKADWLGWKYKYLSRFHSGMIIKDPLSSLLSYWYIKRYGIKVITMVRHPYAFYYSNKRLGWDFDLDNLLNQKSLLNDCLADEAEILNRDLEHPERLAVLWRCIYKYFLFVSSEVDSNYLLFIRHEDLCEKPMQVFGQIFNFLGIEMNNKIQDFISISTSSANKTEVNGQMHVLERNSKKLKGYWESKISGREKKQISNYVDDVMGEFYNR